MGIVDVLLQGAKYAALAFIPYCLFVASYRLFFHPLSKYPGPLAAKLSDAYAGFYAISMGLHLATSRDQKKFGPVMRHGPNKLIFNSAEALQDIYNNGRLTKSRVYLLTSAPGNTSIFNTLDKRQHSIRRRLIGQAISERATRDFEPTLTAQIDVYLQRILEASQSSRPVDMTTHLKQLGMDVVGLLAFGFPLNLQTDPKYRFMMRGLSMGGYRAHCFMQCPPLKHLGFLFFIAGWSQRKKYVQMMQRMIGTRLSEDKHARHDLYSVVADHLDLTGGVDVDSITTSQLWSEALFFFPAGGETTSTALSSLFFYLSQNPHAYKRLADEIRTTFANDTDIHGGAKLSGCRYLRACIDEALRMTPPVSGTPWRELPPEDRCQPLIIDGHVVPSGTQVGVCLYSLHHNEKYFAEPYTFRPERWLVDDEAQLRLINSAFCPFSIGARGCAGKAMAYLEASLVVAKTLWAFDFKPAPGGKTGGGAPSKREGRRRENEFQLYDIFAAMHAGPELVFSPRCGAL